MLQSSSLFISLLCSLFCYGINVIVYYPYLWESFWDKDMWKSYYLHKVIILYSIVTAWESLIERLMLQRLFQLLVQQQLVLIFERQHWNLFLWFEIIKSFPFSSFYIKAQMLSFLSFVTYHWLDQHSMKLFWLIRLIPRVCNIPLQYLRLWFLHEPCCLRW